MSLIKTVLFWIDSMECLAFAMLAPYCNIRNINSEDMKVGLEMNHTWETICLQSMIYIKGNVITLFIFTVFISR